MANEFLDYLSQQEPSREPAGDKSLFEKWLYGEPVVLEGPSSIKTQPIIPNQNTVMPVGTVPIRKRVTVPTLTQSTIAPTQEELTPAYESKSGLSKAGVDVYDQAIAKARQAEQTVKGAVEKSELDRKSNMALATPDYYGTALKMQDIVEGKPAMGGKPAEKGLKQLITEYGDEEQVALQRQAEIEKDTQKSLEANQIEIDKNEEAKKKFAEDQMLSPPPEDKINQGRLWADSSMFSKVLMGVGLALSANSTAAMTNSVKIIDSAIQRDIEEQKYNNAQKKLGRENKAKNQLNLFDTYSNFYKNKNQAALLLAARKNKEVANILNSKMASIKNKEMLVKAQELATNYENKANASMQLLYDQALKEKELNRKESFSNTITMAEAELKSANLLAEKARAMKESVAIRKSAPSTTTGQPSKMSAAEKQRLDNIKLGLDAVKGMADAYNKGLNTFSLIGDNEYTYNLRLWEDAIGRLQSGGAINKDEEIRFKKMAPGPADLTKIQKLKLATMKNIMESRLKTMGITPKEPIKRYK